jgi:hypothetical protein
MVLVSLKKQLEAPRLAGRQTATESAVDSTSAADGDGRYELERNLLVNLKRTDLERASAVRLNLEVEDSEQRVVHQVGDYRLELTPRAAADEVLLRLLISLNSKD